MTTRNRCFPPFEKEVHNESVFARGRKAWLFVGSDRGGERAAMLYSLIQTCRLNDVDPLVWLTDVLTRIAELPQGRVHELLPWEWKKLRDQAALAEAA
jgi:transposase